MKKTPFILLLMLFIPLFLFATAASEFGGGGREIPNLLSAVKAANAGDYILLPSGKRYVLTMQEILTARGTFDYDDLSGVKTEIRIDRTEILTISESHTVFRYPDGQSTHLLKTGPSFTSFMKYIMDKYYIAPYIDYWGESRDTRTIDPPSFNVFRATVQFQDISDGYDNVESVTVTAYNYKGENYMMKFIAQPDFQWGNVQGTYSPVGESHEIEFDIE